MKIEYHLTSHAYGNLCSRNRQGLNIGVECQFRRKWKRTLEGAKYNKPIAFIYFYLRPQYINNDASRSKLSRYCSAKTEM